MDFMRIVIMTIFLSLLSVQHGVTEDLDIDPIEKIRLLRDSLSQTLEYERSNEPQEFGYDDIVVFEITAFPAKQINNDVCRDFLILDFSESDTATEQRGTACRKSKENWRPIKQKGIAFQS